MGKNDLSGTLPRLVQAYNELTDIAASIGIEFSIADYGGFRDEATTNQLIAWRDQAVAAGDAYYPVAPYGHSYHDYGAAFDVHITDGGGYTDPLAQLGALASDAGLRWGGNFPGKSKDRPHFELDSDLGPIKEEYSAFRQTGQDPGDQSAGGDGTTTGLVVVGVLIAVLIVGRLFKWGA